ncbi:MAG: hypothetical protein LBD81_01340, partial [Holosporaceae bacterium]|jgi:hypothetical protein|nr:hypothetical protein [Holosporaceae bacterium]
LLRADDFLNDANAAGTTSIAQGGTLDYYIYFASDDNGYAGSGTTGFVTGELYTSILTFTFEPPDT